LSDPQVEPALAAAGLAAPAPDGPWDLDALTVAAWQFRGEVTGARASLDAARAGERVAAAKPPLSFSLTSELVTSALGGMSPWTIALAVSQMFESHGKRQIRTERAAAETALSAADLADALWKVRSDVRRALLDVELAQRESALAQAELALRADFLQWLRTQLTLGAASRPDLATAEADLARATGQAELARIEIPAAENRLAAAVGLPPSGVENFRFTTPDLDALPAPFAEAEGAALRERAVLDRLDLHRALQAYAAAVVDLRSEVAKQFPDWTLGPGLTYDRGDRKLVLGVGLTLPRTAAARAGIERARALVGAAGAQVETVQAQALAQTSGAIERYAAIRAALERAEAARAERAAAVKNAEHRRDLGAADRGDVLSAALAEIESRRAAFAIRRAAVEALSALEQGLEHPVWPGSHL
ncbi:MAG TPA: TolC family protein, partial [Thermoanaerobaculia bacterium]|nr:TolC family protein [Thermoanaerobaculia bacterium]